MALTRKFLKALGIEDTQAEEIISAHAETVDALKAERDQAKADAETAAGSAKELAALKAENEKLKAGNGDAAKVQAEFDAYKKAVETEKANADKTAALDKLLAEIGVTSTGARKILLKSYDLDTVNLKDGSIENADAIRESVKAEYADLISIRGAQGTPPVTPPTGGGSGAKTKDEIMAIKDTASRQKAIAENAELFGYTAE